MALKDIFNKTSASNEPVEDYLELDFENTEDGTGKFLIHVEKLDDYADSDRIQRKVREGNVLLVSIAGLKDKDMSELKRAIARIRKTVMAINGDIAGVSADWLVVCPDFCRVHREEELPEASIERE